MKRFLNLVAALGLSIALPQASARAHTGWYVEGDMLPYVPEADVVPYLVFCTVAALLVTLCGICLHQHGLFRMVWLKPRGQYAYERAAATFAMVTGAFFMIAGSHDYLFSPNLGVADGVPETLIIIQMFIGLAFLLGVATRTAALALGLLWLVSSSYTGLIATLENIWVLGAAVFVAIMGNDYFSLWGKSFFKKKFERFKPYALSWLRLGTGTTLLVLGFSEKLLRPEYGLNFLSLHDWNFMARLGLSFTDYQFVMAAGTVEALFGLIFILGVVTRLNALVVTIVFLIPMFLLGPIELSGHLPHLAAVALLLLFGNGGKFILVKKYKDAVWAD